MKKYLALVLGVIFTLGFAASAFAIVADIPEGTQAAVAKGTRLTLSGNWVMTGNYNKGADLDQSTNLEKADDQSASYSGAVRLYMNFEMSKNTMGHLSFVTIGPSWIVGDPYSTNPPGSLALGNSRKGPILLRQAWLKHTSNMLGFPAGIQIGHQAFEVGTTSFWRHAAPGDDGIRLFFDPTKEVRAELWWSKLSEGGTAGTGPGLGSKTNPTINDDADVYGAILAFKGKGFKMGGDYTVVETQMRGFDSNGALVTTLKAGDHGMRLHNFGLNGDKTFGALNVFAEANLQAGKTDYENSDVKNKGVQYALGASYKLSPATATVLSLVYGFSSGDDNSTDDENNLYISSASSGEGALGATYVYNSVVPTSVGVRNTYLLGNTVYVKVGLLHNFTKDIKLIASYFSLRADKLNSAAAVNGLTTHLSRNIGSEVDGRIEWQIDKNLMWSNSAGYLWTGKFYDIATRSAGNASMARTELTLSF